MTSPLIILLKVCAQGRVSNECAVPGILSWQETCEDDDVSSSLNTSHCTNTDTDIGVYNSLHNFIIRKHCRSFAWSFYSLALSSCLQQQVWNNGTFWQIFSDPNCNMQYSTRIPLSLDNWGNQFMIGECIDVHKHCILCIWDYILEFRISFNLLKFDQLHSLTQMICLFEVWWWRCGTTTEPQNHNSS